MSAVFSHELKNYFQSLTAYVFGAFLLAFTGIGALMYNINAAVSNFEYVLDFCSIVFVVIVPILTMRVIAEERKQKTDQLLYSLPITTTQVILGKYLALLVVYAIPLCIISFYPLLFRRYGEVYLLTAYGSILAFFIMGSALIALGVFISSLTENQGFAAGIGIAAILLNYFSVTLSEYVSSTAYSSLVSLFVIVILLAVVIKKLTKNDVLAYGVGGVLIAGLIGVYIYNGTEKPGGMPRILDDDLFYRVQDIMNKNKNAPARTHGENEYLLTTKLFCGYCKEMMTGYGGTGKSGRAYHYYACKKAKKKKCQKKIVSKQYIEDRVVAECLKLLTPEKIEFIAKKVAEECSKDPDNLTIRELKKSIREAEQAIENLWRAIEQGQAVDMLSECLTKRQEEKKQLEEQLAIEETKRLNLTEPQIKAFLDFVREMPDNDINKRRAIINIFVHSIYLYDDHFTMLINASGRPISVEDIPLEDIEAAFEGASDQMDGCSTMSTPVPPNKKLHSLNGCGVFPCVFKVSRIPCLILQRHK